MEVGDWRQFGVNRPPVEPPVVHVLAGLFGVFLVAELDVRVADQVLVHVLANVQLLDLAVLVLHFGEEFLVGLVKVTLQLVERVLVALYGRLQAVQRAQIEVSEYDRLAEVRNVVDFGALCAVSARADFEEKRAVYLVLLGGKYAS